MADTYGTNGPDIYTVREGESFRGLEGDDQITLDRGGTGEGNQGNDTITVLPGIDWATVWYWSSPNVIYVDLQAGYALDGYGTRDTLINVHNVHGFYRNGDQGYGTDSADAFWLGANYDANIKGGSILIDGRGGIDQATLGPNQNDFAKLGDLVLSVAIDGRSFAAYFKNCPNFIYNFKNIEQFQVWNGLTGISTNYDLQSYIDYSQAGQELLLRGAAGWQHGAVGSAVTVTYSFAAAAPATGGEGGTGFTAFSLEQQQIVRDLLGKLQQQTNIAFQEVSGDTGQIRFAINEQSTTRGYAYVPDLYPNDAKAGDVWLDVQTAQVMQSGQEGYYVLLHEIGHALGLQHPLLSSDTSGATVLPDSLNTMDNTIMADEAISTSVWPIWFGAFDMQALRYLYGSKPYASGDNSYQISGTNTGTNLNILDDGGNDTLDLSQTYVSANIDLRPGHNSSAGQDADGIANSNNISISTSSVIENVLATAGDDLLTGNDANNTFVLNGGNDIVDGKAGLDTAVFNFSTTNAIVSSAITTGSWNVESKNGSGSVQLSNIERIQFADKTINLTVQAKAAAAPQADVARLSELYVAFFNRIPDADGMSYWIDQKSAGQSITSIAESFYAAGVQYSSLTGFSAGMTNADFVKVVYKNVLGRTGSTAPPDADVNYWVGNITSGVDTRGSLINTILSVAHSFKGDATWGWVPNLLDNKIAVAKTFALDWGLNYNTPDESITQGMAIAAAITPTSTDAAVALIGVDPAALHLG